MGDDAERDLRHAEVPPFFHMPVPTLMLITLLNDGTRITIGHDIAVAPRTPPKWSMPSLRSCSTKPHNTETGTKTGGGKGVRKSTS